MSDVCIFNYRSALLGNQTHSWYGASSSSAIPSSWNDDIETNAARNLNAEEMIQKQKTLLQGLFKLLMLLT